MTIHLCFQLKSPIFHRFYKETEISIFVPLSATALGKDAEARNKVFFRNY
jgi:hypothetical protein